MLQVVMMHRTGHCGVTIHALGGLGRSELVEIFLKKKNNLSNSNKKI
jgi:hypothetical protein